MGADALNRLVPVDVLVADLREPNAGVLSAFDTVPKALTGLVGLPNRPLLADVDKLTPAVDVAAVDGGVDILVNGELAVGVDVLVEAGLIQVKKKLAELVTDDGVPVGKPGKLLAVVVAGGALVLAPPDGRPNRPPEEATVVAEGAVTVVLAPPDGRPNRPPVEVTVAAEGAVTVVSAALDGRPNRVLVFGTAVAEGAVTVVSAALDGRPNRLPVEGTVVAGAAVTVVLAPPDGTPNRPPVEANVVAEGAVTLGGLNKPPDVEETAGVPEPKILVV